MALSIRVLNFHSEKIGGGGGGGGEGETNLMFSFLAKFWLSCRREINVDFMNQSGLQEFYSEISNIWFPAKS